jgi:hypothetical protein
MEGLSDHVCVYSWVLLFNRHFVPTSALYWPRQLSPAAPLHERAGSTARLPGLCPGPPASYEDMSSNFMKLHARRVALSNHVNAPSRCYFCRRLGRCPSLKSTISARAQQYTCCHCLLIPVDLFTGSIPFHIRTSSHVLSSVFAAAFRFAILFDRGRPCRAAGALRMSRNLGSQIRRTFSGPRRARYHHRQRLEAAPAENFRRRPRHDARAARDRRSERRQSCGAGGARAGALVRCSPAVPDDRRPRDGACTHRAIWIYTPDLSAVHALPPPAHALCARARALCACRNHRSARGQQTRASQDPFAAFAMAPPSPEASRPDPTAISSSLPSAHSPDAFL